MAGSPSGPPLAERMTEQARTADRSGRRYRHTNGARDSEAVQAFRVVAISTLAVGPHRGGEHTEDAGGRERATDREPHDAGGRFAGGSVCVGSNGAAISIGSAARSSGCAGATPATIDETNIKPSIWRSYTSVHDRIAGVRRWP